MEFEWDEAKARANQLGHGVSFDLAKAIFKDSFAIERLDDRKDYGEERFIIIGMAEGHGPLLLVLHGTRGTYPHDFRPEGNTT